MSRLETQEEYMVELGLLSERDLSYHEQNTIILQLLAEGADDARVKVQDSYSPSIYRVIQIRNDGRRI